MLTKLMPVKIGEGIRLHIIKTDKFKNNLVRVFFQRPLIKEEVTYNALLSMVLPRGTKSLKTTKDVAKTLERLYGASLGSDVSKKGERNIVQFGLSVPNEKYIDDQKIFQQGLDILNELINDPYTENGYFSQNYVTQEKDNLAEKIEGRLNDKMKYSYDRCIEEMCKQENYRFFEYGHLEDIEKINAQNLFDHYQQFIRTSPIDICVVGDIDETLIERSIREKLKFPREKMIDIKREKIEFHPEKVNMTQEKMDINQGKLTLGYRTNIPYESNLYQSVVLFSTILGGGPNSKLFKNVREKESLCYYIFSRIEKFKSLMMIGSGIEFENYDKTVSLINKEIEEMRQGNFEEDDIESAKKYIITSIRSMTDSPNGLADYYFTQAISDNYDSLEEVIEKIRRVNKDMIIEAGKGIVLDTIYFLRDNKGGQ
ncbi:MAG: EF-P 5-aminopentanol modification-associated protein YfmF [Bacillota bacterium]